MFKNKEGHRVTVLMTSIDLSVCVIIIFGFVLTELNYLKKQHQKPTGGVGLPDQSE